MALPKSGRISFAYTTPIAVRISFAKAIVILEKRIMFNTLLRADDPADN